MEIEPKNSHSYLWSIIHKEEEGDDKLFEWKSDSELFCDFKIPEDSFGQLLD